MQAGMHMKSSCLALLALRRLVLNVTSSVCATRARNSLQSQTQISLAWAVEGPRMHAENAG